MIRRVGIRRQPDSQTTGPGRAGRRAATRDLGRILSAVSGTTKSSPHPSTPPAAATPAAPERSWLRDFWQVPLLGLGVAGIVGAILYARAHPPKDDFDGAIAQAEELVEKGELSAAKVVLFEVVAPNIEKAPKELLPRFHAASADYVAAQLRGVERPAKENDLEVVAAYDRAKEHGWTLTSEQLVRYAKSLVRLGRAQEAFTAISASGNDAEADAMRRQVRRDALVGVLSGSAAGSVKSPEQLLAAIDEFRADPSLPATDEAWAAARAAEIRLALDRPKDASDRLLIDLRRIEGASAGGETLDPQVFAELSGLLGEALRRQGRLVEARREFEHANTLVRSGTATATAIDVGLGRTLLALEEHESAARIFDRAVLTEQRGLLALEALLGRAQARAALVEPADPAAAGAPGADPAASSAADGALRDYAMLREAIRRGETGAQLALDAERALIASADDALADGLPSIALGYAELAADLRPGVPASAAALLRVATAARQEADRMLAAANASNPAAGAIEPETRARINRLLKRAGDAFASHANAPETKGSQDGSFAASLWAAADSYDLAGWRESAIANFAAYLEATQPEDLARADAYWRIAVLNHAEGAYDEAAKFYLKTIEVSENQRPKAIVPLARALAAGGRVADATQQLQSVVDGVAGLKPSAEEYFEALDLYARLSFEKGDAVRSAELLREAIARRPEDARVGELAFRLGESLRVVARSAREVAESGDVSVARRDQLLREGSERMREARRAFEQTIAALEPRGEALDALARDMVREAHLSRAHCAYDLGQFEDAIPLYEAVDRKYPEHASSMVALIQIVNCCDALGDATRAETAHRRAQLRLARLPDDAFLAGGGILARESWEQWLRNHPPGGRRMAGTDGAAEGEAP